MNNVMKTCWRIDVCNIFVFLIGANIPFRQRIDRLIEVNLSQSSRGECLKLLTITSRCYQRNDSLSLK